MLQARSLTHCSQHDCFFLSRSVHSSFFTLSKGSVAVAVRDLSFLGETWVRGFRQICIWIITKSKKKVQILMFHITYPRRRGFRLSQKRKKQEDFLVPSPTKKQPGPEFSNASGWYGRLRGPIPSLLVFNSVQLSQQSFHAWHFLTKIDSSSG